MNLDRQIVELLSLNFDQLSQLKKFGEAKLQKAFRSTLKYAGNKEVYDRRKYFKECLKSYGTQLQLAFVETRDVKEETHVNVSSVKEMYKDKPWSKP